MAFEKSLDGVTDLTPEALDALYRSMSWDELDERSVVLETEMEILRRAMEERAPQIQYLDSLSTDELERHVRAKKPEWQYAKRLLEGRPKAGR
jgi:hypothetical protein